MARAIRTTAGAALITAVAAALPALASAATLAVRATSNGLPVSVAVSATGPAGQAIATSDASGAVSLSLPAGTYAVTAGAPGYKPARYRATLVVADAAGNRSRSLTRPASRSFVGRVPRRGRS
jgi:hypothetical protein